MNNKTLIIYGPDGEIIMSQSGFPEPQSPMGDTFIFTEIPNGKRLVKVDISGVVPTPIFEDIPKTEVEILQQALSEATMLLASQQAQIDNANLAISELSMLITGGNEDV